MDREKGSLEGRHGTRIPFMVLTVIISIQELMEQREAR